MKGHELGHEEKMEWGIKGHEIGNEGKFSGHEREFAGDEGKWSGKCRSKPAMARSVVNDEPLHRVVLRALPSNLFGSAGSPRVLKTPPNKFEGATRQLCQRLLPHVTISVSSGDGAR